MGAPNSQGSPGSGAVAWAPTIIKGALILVATIVLILIMVWIKDGVTEAQRRRQQEADADTARRRLAEDRAAEAAAAAQAQRDAEEKLVTLTRACRADPSDPRCDQVTAAREAAKAAAEQAAQAAADAARAAEEDYQRTHPCAAWEKAGSVGPPPVACRIWKIQVLGDTTECAKCLAEQPQWGEDVFNPNRTQAHAASCCPIKGACREKGLSYWTAIGSNQTRSPAQDCL